MHFRNQQIFWKRKEKLEEKNIGRMNTLNTSALSSVGPPDCSSGPAEMPPMLFAWPVGLHNSTHRHSGVHARRDQHVTSSSQA